MVTCFLYACEKWQQACYTDGDFALARKICWTFDLLGERQGFGDSTDNALYKAVGK